MSSRAGGEMLETAFESIFLLGQPLLAGGGVDEAALITAVGADEANVDPPAFLASTLNRIVLPTSALVST